MIFNWVNKAYAQKFWQLKATRSVIENIYRGVLENPQAHSFIGLIGEKPICQVDVYAVAADELAEHIDAEPGDCGLHLLMCPPREMQKGWSHYALRCFQEFYFSAEQSGRLFAEPDQENYHANQLAMNTGFHFEKTIEMSYKTANLYYMRREDFRPV
jgi:RimJ/RimL family protein N-acetyltransferase